jgi:hypothetical protein
VCSLAAVLRICGARNTSQEEALLQRRMGNDALRPGAARAFLKRATYVSVLIITAALGVIAALGQQFGGAGVHGELSRSRISAFVGVSVMPMDSERILADQVVLVQDEYILDIGPSRALHIPPGATRIEGHGLFLFPGLADMHVHLMEGEVTFPLFRANGVTTVRSMAGGPEMSQLRDR